MVADTELFPAASYALTPIWYVVRHERPVTR
jgi:hypothetical protein